MSKRLIIVIIDIVVLFGNLIIYAVSRNIFLLGLIIIFMFIFVTDWNAWLKK